MREKYYVLSKCNCCGREYVSNGTIELEEEERRIISEGKKESELYWEAYKLRRPWCEVLHEDYYEDGKKTYDTFKPIGTLSENEKKVRTNLLLINNIRLLQEEPEKYFKFLAEEDNWKREAFEAIEFLSKLKEDYFDYFGKAADRILSFDLKASMQSDTMYYTPIHGIANFVFEIYEKFEDKSNLENIFFELMGKTFDEYLAYLEDKMKQRIIAVSKIGDKHWTKEFAANCVRESIRGSWYIPLEKMRHNSGHKVGEEKPYKPAFSYSCYIEAEKNIKKFPGCCYYRR